VGTLVLLLLLLLLLPVLLLLLLLPHGRTWMTSVTPATVSSHGPCSIIQ
jgi:hypothetical protein